VCKCSSFKFEYRIYRAPYHHSKPRALAMHGVRSPNAILRCRTGRRLLRLGLHALDLNDQFRATLRTRRFLSNRGSKTSISRRTRWTASLTGIWVSEFRFQNVSRDGIHRANTKISKVLGKLLTTSMAVLDAKKMKTSGCPLLLNAEVLYLPLQ